jgi:hypothetical protein
MFRVNVVVGANASLAFGSPAAAQSGDSPVTGYGACRVSTRITRPFPIADGVVQKDLERLVRHWNMNSKVPSMDGRCAVGTVAEIQEYVTKWSTENGLEIVDFKPDWQIITFNRLGGDGQEKAVAEPSRADISTTPKTLKGSSLGSLAQDEQRKKALEAHAAVEERNRQAQAKYEAELAEQKRKVAEYEQAQRDIEAKKAEQRAAADRVLAEHQRRMNVHAQEVRMAGAASLDYKKTLAKPANAPSAVYRGFTGNDCALARLSALKGAGTDSGTQFKEVESEMVSGHCVVRGWWWSTSKSGSSRQ